MDLDSDSPLTWTSEAMDLPIHSDPATPEMIMAAIAELQAAGIESDSEIVYFIGYMLDHQPLEFQDQ